MRGKQYVTNLWILNNAVILYRIIRGFVRALVFRKNTLKTLETYPTFECNSKCKMCSVSKFEETEKLQLSLEDYETIAEQGAKMGAIAMTVLGGEPLLYKNLDGLIKIFKNKHYFVAIVSNSLLITEQRVIGLMRAGLDSIYFSLESLDEEINDEIRGVIGHYKSVMNAIRICKKQGLRVGIAGVIQPGHMDRFIELLEFCRENDLLATGGELAPIGRGENGDIISATEHSHVKALLTKYPKLTFDWGLSYFLKCRCPAGKEKIGITCYGDVIGCSLNPISFGNILHEPLKAIWKRMGRFSQYKKYSEGCISAGDVDFINNYIVPIYSVNKNPVSYKVHPMINHKTEPKLFK